MKKLINFAAILTFTMSSSMSFAFGFSSDDGPSWNNGPKRGWSDGPGWNSGPRMNWNDGLN